MDEVIHWVEIDWTVKTRHYNELGMSRDEADARAVAVTAFFLACVCLVWLLS